MIVIQANTIVFAIAAIFYVGNAEAGVTRVFCRSEARPELLICQDKGGTYLSGIGERERLRHFDFYHTRVFVNRDRTIFIESALADRNRYLIDENGVRTQLVCSPPELDFC